MKSPLEDAVRRQEAAVLLKTLADRWTEVEPSAVPQGSLYRGFESLKEKGGLAHTGVLFLEAKGESNETRQPKLHGASTPEVHCTPPYRLIARIISFKRPACPRS